MSPVYCLKRSLLPHRSGKQWYCGRYQMWTRQNQTPRASPVHRKKNNTRPPSSHRCTQVLPRKQTRLQDEDGAHWSGSGVRSERMIYPAQLNPHLCSRPLARKLAAIICPTGGGRSEQTLPPEMGPELPVSCPPVVRRLWNDRAEGIPRSPSSPQQYIVR